AFFVRCRQSLAGRLDTFAPLSRTRIRRGVNEQASAWLAAVDGLTAVHNRLRAVAILNRDGLDVIRQQDGPGTLFYLDPPYLPEPRTAPDVYRHELTPEAHVELITLVKRCKGKVVVSGYPNALYDREVASWTRYDFDLPNHAASGGRKRRMVECVWCNF